MSDLKVSNFLLVFCVCALLYLLLNYMWRNRRLYYHAARINGPSPLTILANAYFCLTGIRNVYEEGMRIVRQYQPVFKFWLAHKLFVVVTNPKDVEVVLNSALDKEEHYQFFAPLFGDGLMTLPAEQWRKHRKVIGLTFNQQILNSFMDTFDSYSQVLVGKLRETLGKGCVDLFPILSKCTVDIVCDTTMGVKVHAMEEGSQYISWMLRVAHLGNLRAFNVFLHPSFIWKMTSWSKEMQILSKKLHDYARKLIDMKRQSGFLQEGASKRKIFLDHLLELTKQDGKWSDEETIAETRTVILTGSDTTALTICYVLMMLGMHPETQDRVYKEISSIFKKSDRKVILEDVQKMPYLERVIKETLRILPVISVVGRQVTKDIILDDTTCIPKGSSVLIPIICIQRDPEIWPDPLTFNPDRFLPEEVSQRHPYSYLPFSGGVRNCIGYRYAIMVMKTILSTVLRNYKVVGTGYKSVSEIELKLDVSTKCVGGNQVELESRI